MFPLVVEKSFYLVLIRFLRFSLEIQGCRQDLGFYFKNVRDFKGQIIMKKFQHSILIYGVTYIQM